MKRSVLVFTTVFLCLVLILTFVSACSSNLAPTSAPGPSSSAPASTSAQAKSSTTSNPATIELSYSDFQLESTPQAQMAKMYLDEVAKMSNGRIKFKYYWDGSLTQAMETLPAVRGGSVDVSDPAPAYFPSDEPLLNIFNSCRIPFDVKTAMTQGMEAMWYSGDVSKALQDESARQNTKLLYWFPMSYIIVTKQNIQKLSDLNNLKLRAIGIYEPEVLKSFGALPVTVLPAEMYESLQRGSLDGLSGIYDMMTDLKIYEVAKYVSFENGAIMSQPMCMNLDTWNNKIPDDLKAQIESRDFRTKILNDFLNLYDQRLQKTEKTMKDNGMVFVNVDPKEQQQVKDTWLKVVVNSFPVETGKVGYGDQGTQLLDKWLQLVTGKNLADTKAQLGIK